MYTNENGDKDIVTDIIQFPKLEFHHTVQTFELHGGVEVEFKMFSHTKLLSYAISCN